MLKTGLSTNMKILPTNKKLGNPYRGTLKYLPKVHAFDIGLYFSPVTYLSTMHCQYL